MAARLLGVEDESGYKGNVTYLNIFQVAEYGQEQQ